MASDPLSGGVAVVTGAAGGIGAGIARAAAARGMKLVLADIAAGPLQAIAEELQGAGAEVLAQPTDVTDPAALDRLADAAYARFGAVRMLVNNAGIETLGYSWELSAETWERAIRINVLGPIQGVRAFAPRMVAAQQPAHIVNIASIAALGMTPVQTAYILGKHAVLSFSECLSLEMQLKAPMISVSAVLPGPVDTAIFKVAPGGNTPASIDRHREIMQELLASQGLHPDEAGRMIVDQAAQRRFWIATHPEMLQASATARAEHLSGLLEPKLKPAVRAMLGDPATG